MLLRRSNDACEWNDRGLREKQHADQRFYTILNNII